MARGILPFSIKYTKGKITDRGGLAIMAEFMETIGLKRQIEKEYPLPGSNRGFRGWEYIRELVFHFLDGGRHLEDLDDLEMDEGFRLLNDISHLPTADAVGDWLRKQGQLHRESILQRVNDNLVRIHLNRGNLSDYVLDLDATLIESDKGDGTKGYDGTVGYHPLLGFLSDGTDRPLCSYVRFRRGNASPQADILGGLQHSQRLLRQSCQKLKYFRSDSAGYQSKVVNYCEVQKISYTITADLDISVRERIRMIKASEWRPFYDREGIKTDRQWTETVHTMNASNHSFRLIVLRQSTVQGELFGGFADHGGYYALISNIPKEEMDGPAVLHHHQGRGNCERFIEDGKYGLNLRYLPCGTIEANRIYYSIGILSYNLMKLFQLLVLSAQWLTSLISTVRRKVLRTVGQVIRSGRRMWLGIHYSRERLKELTEIRARIACLAPG